MDKAAAKRCVPLTYQPFNCECSFNRTVRPATAFPQCVPSAFCRRGRNDAVRVPLHADSKLSQQTVALESPSSYIIVAGYNASQVRYWYRADPFRSYLNAARLVTRLVLSLREVGAELPINLLVSGERHAQFDALLSRELRVGVIAANESVRVPRWASDFHLGSFAKLAALALVQFRKLVVLDADTLVLRNIDRLVQAPAPAFVVRFKCFRYFDPLWELNSGVMVLQPDEHASRTLLDLMNRGGRLSLDGGPRAQPGSNRSHRALPVEHLGVAGDRGEQSIWRSFYRIAHELPLRFNALRSTRFRDARDWAEVSVLHDTDTSRKVPIPHEALAARYTRLTDAARERVARIARSLHIEDRG